MQSQTKTTSTDPVSCALIQRGSRHARFQFRARVELHDDEIVHTEFWDDELTPMQSGHRRTAEWAQEHVQGCWFREDYNDRFELPPTGNFEVVFSATISGWYDDFNGEWDEEVEISGYVKQALTEEYMLMSDAYCDAADSLKL
jgi:hypothetical protein